MSSAKSIHRLETNVTLTVLATQEGRMYEEMSLMPSSNLDVPSWIEAFPVANVVFSGGLYVATSFSLGTNDPQDRAGFQTRNEAINWCLDAAHDVLEKIRDNSADIVRAYKVAYANAHLTRSHSTRH